VQQLGAVERSGRERQRQGRWASGSFSDHRARAGALTSVLSGCGSLAGTISPPSGHDALAPPRRWSSNGFDCRRAAGQPIVACCAIDGARDGRTAMAKGQKRSNREAKKPKADKKKSIAPAGTVPNALAKPKPGAATAGSKK
jgi:hypothetical protein